MLRIYQVNMVSGGSDNHSSPWSLKERPQDHSQQGRGQAVSTHILGLGVVLAGALVMAVGLIMGLEFPKYVRDRGKDEVCVVYSGSEGYDTWVSDAWNAIVI